MTGLFDVQVGPADGYARRVVIATKNGSSHRDNFDTNSGKKLKSFARDVAEKFGLCEDEESQLEDSILAKADERDAEPEMASSRDSQSTKLVKLAIEAGVELFHTSNDVAYATWPVDGHKETSQIGSRKFTLSLRHLYLNQYNASPGGQSIKDAVGTLESKALFEGDECDVHIRVALLNGRVYVDLCNDQWHAVEISSTGWKVIDDAPVKFVRSPSMRPLPAPAPGGSIEDLDEFVNAEPDDRKLVAAWILQAMYHPGPFPILSIHGEQGSAKTTLARTCRALVDPAEPPTRAAPRDERNLMVGLKHAWVVPFDNLSKVPDWLSDALSRVSVGGGLGERRLHTNDEEVVFTAKRPVILNGIPDLATQGDLLDRCLLICLRSIKESQRIDEKTLWNRFHEVQPRILGAFYTVLSAALAGLPNVQPESMPRMADFFKLIVAAEPALGWEPGTFKRIYATNRANANNVVIEANVLAKPLIEFVEQKVRWEGPATELLGHLNRKVGEKFKYNRNWPKAPNALSGQLRRLAPHLRQHGIHVDFDRDSNGRRIILEKTDVDAKHKDEIVEGEI